LIELQPDKSTPENALLELVLPEDNSDDIELVVHNEIDDILPPSFKIKH
jgi:hypothetical protein